MGYAEGEGGQDVGKVRPAPAGADQWDGSPAGVMPNGFAVRVRIEPEPAGVGRGKVRDRAASGAAARSVRRGRAGDATATGRRRITPARPLPGGRVARPHGWGGRPGEATSSRGLATGGPHGAQ